VTSEEAVMESVLMTTKNNDYARSLEIAKKAASSHVNLLLVVVIGQNRTVPGYCNRSNKKHKLLE